MPVPSIATESSLASKSASCEFGETKRCSKCIERLPTSAFRRLRTGREARHSECNQCRNLRESALVALKRRTVRRKELLGRLERLTAMRSRSRYAALVEDTIIRFGGPERLAKTFHAVFDDAREQGDLRTASRILLGIASLCQRSEPLREASLDTDKPVTCVVGGNSSPSEAPELSQMTDAQLDAWQRSLKRQV